MSIFAILNNRCYSESGRMRLAYIVLLAVGILLGLLLLVIGYKDQWDATKHDLVLVDKYVQNPRWSKNGRTLFYIDPKGRETLRAYDVNTGKNRGYDVPVREPYDISPDGKSVVCLQSLHSLAILRLDTGYTKTIYSSRRQIGDVFWLPQNKIAFELFITRDITKGADVIIIDVKGKLLKELRGIYYTRLYAAYGRGVVYAGKDELYHYYNVDANVDRILDMHGIKFGNDTTRFLYMSDKCLVYWTTRFDDGHAELLDLQSGKIKPIRSLPTSCSGNWTSISPDMSRCSSWIGGIGESAVPKIYVGTFSPRVTKQFAGFGCINNKDRHPDVQNVHP